MRRMKYALRDVPSNPSLATVDDITLDRGGEPAELTEDQHERLKATGVKLEEITPPQPPAREPNPRAGN